MQIVKAAAGAAVLSLLIAGSSGSAFAQPLPSAPQSVDYQRASGHITVLAEIAAKAGTADNCARKSIYTNRLWDIYQNANNIFWKQHPLTASEHDQLAKEIRDGVEKLNQMPCPRPKIGFGTDGEKLAQPARPTIPVDPYSLNVPPWRLGTANVEISPLAGGNVQTHAKRSYLGARIGGSDFIGLFTPDQKSTGESFGVSAKIDLSGAIPALRLGGWDAAMPKSTWMRFGASYSKSDTDQSIGTISPGPGNAMLVPGAGGGATGFSLPAPGNEVQGARYILNSKLYSTRLDFGQTCQYSPDFSVGGYGGVGYRRNNFDERFSGSIPGFLRNFDYATNVDVNELDIRAGLQFERRVLLQQGLTLLASGWVEIGLAVLHANGIDTLAFTGFPDSSAGLSKNKSSAAFAVGGSVGLTTVGGATIGVAATYETANNDPVVVRDGTNPSKLDLKQGQAITLTAGLKLKY